MPDPAGILSLCQETLKNTLGDSDTFRTLCGAADRAGALARIHHERLPAPDNGEEYSAEELQDLWPNAVVSTDIAEGFFLAADSATSYQGGGTLWLMIARILPQGDDAAIDRQFKNWVGAIIEDLCALAITGQSDDETPVIYLQFSRIGLLIGPMRNAESTLPANRLEQFVVLEIRVENVVLSAA